MPAGVTLREKRPHHEIVGYALLVECKLGREEIMIHLDYDDNVLEEWTVCEIAEALESMIDLLNQSRDETRIGDLLRQAVKDHDVMS
jgi:hypothetical protein